MSSVITTSPTLNYVSSADISTTSDTNGYLRYQIYFHESVVTYGNIIMFEYMIQPKLNTIFSPANTVYGFLSVDVATTTGILNQYVLTVPASEQTYTGISEDTIQFRVYTGDKDTNDVIVTEWSNALNVFNPAVEPNFSSAFAYFDENIPDNNNDLYVFFDSANNPYDYGLPEDPNTGMKFIVCYYYKKSSDGSTIWGVSDPLHAEPLAGHPTYKVLKINNIERVLDGERIYLNVHADYNWQYNNNNYYSVSSASADLIAYEAINDSAPDITTVAYKVYDINQLQQIDITWNAPQNSIVTNFEVQSYQVYVNINGGEYVPYGDLLPKTVKTLMVDVSNLDCEDTIQFLVEVTTVLEQVTRSPPSSIVNIFKHAGPVSSLVVNDTSVALDNSVSLLVNFYNSSYTGCGAPKHYVVRINNKDYTPVSGSLGYVPNTSYSIRYNLPAVNGLPLKTGNVDVALVTEDTNNSSNLLEGEHTFAPYIANNLLLQPVSYDVYNVGQNQKMNLTWNNISLVNWLVVNYRVEAKVDNNNWLVVAGGDPNTPYTNTSYTYNVNLTSVPQNISFKVIATVVNNTNPSSPVSYNIVSNIESKYTFLHAGPVSNLVINNTSVNNDNTVNLIVNFQSVSNRGLGVADNYNIKINGYNVYTPTAISVNGVAKNSLAHFDNSQYSVSYTIPAVNGVAVKTGLVDISLMTMNTNSSNLIEGAILSAPYIANNLVLQPVSYDVYNVAQNQIMNLNWNTLNVGAWLVTNYLVEVKIGTGNWLPVAGDNLASPYTNTVYAYNVNLTSVPQNISFKVIATVVNNTNPSSPVSYNIVSNIESKYTFSYAGPVSNLVVTNTSVNLDNTVNLTVKYNGVVNRGLGAGDKYAVEINGQSYTPSSGSLTYDTVNPTKEYSVSYILPASNGNPVKFGVVNVYLETVNTNLLPVNPMKGQQTTAPYFANNLVIQPVDYSVYNNKAQIMNLSWNDLAVGPWVVTSYKVEAKIGAGPWIVNAGGDLNSPYTNTSYSYVVDLSTSSNTAAIQFRVTGYVNNNTVNYNTLSNIVSKNTFSHPGKVSGLVVKNTSVASGNVVMLTVEFTGVANVGINTQDTYVVKINGNSYSPTSGNLSYVPNKPYSVSYALAPVNGTPFPKVGTVDVNLQVLNTNSPFDIIDGDLSSAPYIANNLTLDALIYDVYTNNTQNVLLSWNNITLTPWTLINHIVYVKQGLGSWTQVISTTNNMYTYLVDTSNTALLTFKVVTTVGNGPVNYDVTSNEQTINPFSYSKPVSNVVVNWAVTNTSNSIMDAFVSFDRPSNTGVNNGIEKYVVRLLNNNSGLIQSKDVIPVVNTIRENVYFDDVVYSNVGNIIIDVYVKDNNNNNNPITLFNESQYIISYVTSSIPLFINVSFNAASSQLSGTIVTEDVLKRAGRLIYIDNNSLKEVQINTSGVLTTGFNISDPIPNPNADGTLSYNFVLNYSSFQGLTASNSLSVSVSNNFGIGTLIKNRI